MKRHGLLVVDDEKEILRSLTLTFTDDYEVFTASSGAEALNILKNQEIALVIADQRMPEMTGVELLEQVIAINPYIIRIILTGYTDTASLIQAVNKGHIYQYITKPWERQELRIIVKRALESYALTLENQRLLKELQVANERLKDENAFLRSEVIKEWQCADIIGQSPVMQRVFQLVNRVLDNSVTVLLTGETGTGKTLLACYIHHYGPRKDKLFVEQNCGTLPEALLESELFGHKRGAFTGAVQDRKGLFEVADGGTLFLDEISEMSPALQVKILQVLQEGRFRRVGENEYRQADVRIIAATNRDLQVEIQKGRFRADLFYRINVFPIHIPPLRDRIADIRLLADYCLEKYRRKLNSQVTGFSEEALQILCGYDYPGNVRELENLIERALILSTGPRIEAGEWLPVLPISTSGMTRLEHLERAEIERLLERHQGNLILVARELGISRTTLWRRLKDYRLQSDQDARVSQ
jgi:DNA-binding NtrC family response regulator